MTEFWDVSVLFFSETWPCDKISDDSISNDGFGLPHFNGQGQNWNWEISRGMGVPLHE